MNFLRSLLLCVMIFFTTSGALPAETTLQMPPKITHQFLQSVYKGQISKPLYDLMSPAYCQENSYKDFKRALQSQHKAKTGSKIKTKIISEANLSNNEGVLYIMTKIDPFLFFGKKYVLIDRVKVIRSEDGWSLKEIPEQLFVFTDYTRLKKKEMMSVFQVIKIDRQKEILNSSAKISIARTLQEAQRYTAEKDYRNALMSYEKVLKLDDNNNDAKQGLNYCQQQLQNE